MSMSLETLLVVVNGAVAAVREVVCAAGHPKAQQFHEDALVALHYLGCAKQGDMDVLRRVSPYWERFQARYAVDAFDDALMHAAFRAMCAMESLSRRNYKWAEINAGLALDSVGLPHKCQPYSVGPSAQDRS